MGKEDMEKCKVCQGYAKDMKRHLEYSKIYGGKCHVKVK